MKKLINLRPSPVPPYAGPPVAPRGGSAWFLMERLEPRRVFNATLPTAGAIDVTFGNDGIASVDVEAGWRPDGGWEPAVAAWASAVDAGGKVLVAGSVYDYNSTTAGTIVLTRLNPDGTSDATFAQGGTARLAFGGPANANRMLIQSDGKIVLVGDAPGPTAGATGGAAGDNTPDLDQDRQMLVVGYNADGSLDATFGNGGVVLSDFGPGDDEAWGLALQPDGKLVVSGEAGDRQALLRFNHDGTPDPTFARNGCALTRLLLLPPAGVNAVDVAYVALDSAGVSDAPGTGPPRMAYGDAGVSVLPDGRLLVVGNTGYAHGAALDASLLALYAPDGTLQSLRSLGSGGAGVSSAINFAVQPDGKVLVFSYRDALVRRYNPDGALDASFGAGSDGSFAGSDVGNYFAAAGYSIDNVNEGKLLPDGKILLAAQSSSYGHGFGSLTVIRLNPDGTPDTTFGNAGIIIASDGASGATALAVAPDGSAYAAGAAADGYSTIVIVHVLADRGPGPVSASLEPVAPYTDRSAGPLTLAVTYRSAAGIDPTSIGAWDISAVRDDGNSLYLYHISDAVAHPDGSETVLYSLNTGQPAFLDNGDYTVSVDYGGGVYGRDGGVAPYQVLGHFILQLPDDGIGDHSGGSGADAGADFDNGPGGPQALSDHAASAGSADGLFADGLTDPAALTNRGLAGDAPATPADSTAADGFLRSVNSVIDRLASTGGADDTSVWM